MLSNGRFQVQHGDALEVLRGMPSTSVDLVFTSPPYEDSRTYQKGWIGDKFKLKGQQWVTWLAEIVGECARVSKGLVIVNVSSPVRGGQYSAAVEWLVTDLTREYGLACGPAPYAWVKNGIPGKRTIGHRRCWEPLYAFARPDRLPLHWCDLTAFCEAPKYDEGGNFRAYTKTGKRKSQNAWRGKIALAGNAIYVKVGGGHMGSHKASMNEAAMPVSLAERFVCWYCRPDGIVCDPFCGSGTTGHAALMHARRFVGCDIRRNMVDLTASRLQDVQPPVLEMASGYSI